ncbi:MAG: methyltransferase domain-containing protein [Acidobacteriota bacterium]
MKAPRLYLTLAVLVAVAVAVWQSWYELSRLDWTRIHNRAGWQLPDRVIAALDIEPGDVVADLGAGKGYFTFRLAKAVGRSGRVYAVDVEDRIVGDLEVRVELENAVNVGVIHGEYADPRLPDGGMDLIFLCNTYHHLESRSEYFKRLRRDLEPGGRVAVIDMRDDVTGIGAFFVDENHWTPWADLLGEMEIAGYTLEQRFDFLPMQNFAIFRAPR